MKFGNFDSSKFWPVPGFGVWIPNKQQALHSSIREYFTDNNFIILLITPITTAFVLARGLLLIKLYWNKPEMFGGQNFQPISLFLLRVHHVHHFYRHSKMGASIQSGETQLVKSRGSFQRDIPRDTNIGQYGLFTFVITGLENVGSRT